MRWLATALAAVFLCLSPANADPLCARAYTMTGLAGVEGGFSLGVWAEANNIAKAYPCVKTYKRRWAGSSSVYLTAKANYEIDKLPIFLIGHSLGANEAVKVATRLKRDGIPVATVFAYDPTPFVWCIPSNVKTAIGWRGTLLFNLGKGRISACPGSKAAIEDHPLAVSHVFIDDLPSVHALTTKHIGEVLHMLKEIQGK